MKAQGDSEVLDVVVIGAGPAALVTLYEAKARGLRSLAIDKGPICGALVSHPTYMRWFSTADKLELCGFPLLTVEKNPTREEYLRYCRAFVNYFQLPVLTYHEVRGLVREDGLFRVEGQNLYGRSCQWRARNVVAATGFYDSPRPLEVPGADLPKVRYRYTESHFYADHDILVIGAGSSAAEVALELYRAGSGVTVCMRGDRFHTKYWIEPDIENRVAEGSIACHRNSEVVEVRMDDVVIRDAEGALVEVANDFVLAMTGYEPDTRLLEAVGAEIDGETKKPQLSDDFETTVPGLYVAGTLCAGVESNVIFIENSRGHGPRIAEHIAASGQARSE